MAQRSSGPGRHRTTQHREEQLALRGDKGKTTFPPIGRDNTVPAQYSATQRSMTGGLGMPSRQPMIARPPDKRHIETDRSKTHRRTSSKDIPGTSQTHGQKQGGTSPKPQRSVKRSESYDPKRTPSGYRRSSSTSSMPYSVSVSSKPLPCDEVSAGFNDRSKEFRQTKSHGVWAGSGYNPIAHRTPHNTRVSNKKESTHSVQESDDCDLLAQSAVKSFSTHRYQLSQHESSTSSNGSLNNLQPQFDALTFTQSITQSWTTEKVSASSHVKKQPLHDHVDQSSSKDITEGTIAGELSGTAATSSASPLDSKPEERQLLKVCNMVLQRWKEICTHLCIPACKISESEQNNVGNVSQACFAAMLWWREGNCRKMDSPPTWRVLLDAMREAGFPDTADSVQGKITSGVL